jgi:probable O-glycosylation ligase (exosortase A-associated)
MAYWAIAKLGTDVDRIKGIFKALIFVHLLVALLNPQMILEPEVRHYVASGAFLGDGNDYALSVNITIPFCLFLIFDAPKFRQKLFYGAVLVFLILMIVATQSRGGTIALACVGIYYWAKSDRKVAMASVAAAALVAVFLFAPAAYFERMNQVTPEESSAQGRILAWKGAMRMAVDHPLLGVGAGHFPVKYGAEYRTSMDVPWQTAHSVYFLALGELGFPGLIFVLTYIFGNLAANRGVAVRRRAHGGPTARSDANLMVCLSASLIAFATGGAFLSALYYPHIYVLGGILVAARRVVNDHVDSADAGSGGETAERAGPLVRGGISTEWRPRRAIASTLSGPRLVRREALTW